MDMQDGGIRDTIIQTTFFATVGLATAIAFYVFRSKWICCRGGPKSLFDILAETSFAKAIMERVSRTFKKIKCCKKDSNCEDEEKGTGINDGLDEGKETESGQNDGLDEGKEIESSKDDDLDKGEDKVSQEAPEEFDKKHESEQTTQDKDADKAEVSVKQPRKGPLVSSGSLRNLVMFLYVSSKVVLIISNIVYFCIAKPADLDDPSFSANQLQGMQQSFFLTLAGFSNEILGLLVTPLVLFICRKCWGVTCANFGEYFRYYDLQFALMCSPFASVHLHYLGGAYWIFIIVRTCIYSITFAALIILGFRFLFATYCYKCCDIPCCSVTEAIEIKDWKHLFKDVGLHLIPLTIKLTTGSSALATYLKIGVLQSDPVKFTYLVFTLLSCLNAVSSVFYDAVVLRWIVMKEDNKNDGSFGSKALEFLKVKTPSAHISFAIAVCINCGLIVLNAYILNYGNFQ